jgi:hypothetical protein
VEHVARFAALIAKWHGPQGLEALRHVADGFQPREWALLIPRQGLSSALTVLFTRPYAAARGEQAPFTDPAPQPDPPPAVETLDTDRRC